MDFITEPNVKISPNFNSSEFKCPHCGKISIASNLIYYLQAFRDLINVPIYITSGYRCKIHNKQVNGMGCSLHRISTAVDFYFDYKKIFDSPKDIFQSIFNLNKFDGIGLYFRRDKSLNFIHLDINPYKYCNPEDLPIDYQFDCKNYVPNRPLFWIYTPKTKYKYYKEYNTMLSKLKNFNLG